MRDPDEVMQGMVDRYYDEVTELKKELLKQSAEIVRLSGLLCQAPACVTCKYEAVPCTQLPCAACDCEFEHDMWELKEGK